MSHTINATAAQIKEMLEQDKYIDLIIPRGGNSLVQFVKENTKIPVLGHADGICHIYVDAKADIDRALNIIENAKTSRPSVCNSIFHCPFLLNTSIIVRFCQ